MRAVASPVFRAAGRALPALLLGGAATLVPAAAAAAELVFNPIVPCRIADTRCSGIGPAFCTPHALVHGNVYSFVVGGPATDYRAQGGSPAAEPAAP
jgi:hypothetical protein